MIAELFYMDTTIWVKAPYKAIFITALKEQIPKEYRYWDKDERAWVVNYAYESELLTLCSEYFSDVSKYGERRYNTTPRAIQSPPAYQTLHLLPTAPKEVVMAAYRALSKLYHPDVNNSSDATKKMVKINAAFSEIMGRR